VEIWFLGEIFMVNFSEAFAGLVVGKKIRRESWKQPYWISLRVPQPCLNWDRFIHKAFTYSDSPYCYPILLSKYLSEEDLFAFDWQIEDIGDCDYRKLSVENDKEFLCLRNDESQIKPVQKDVGLFRRVLHFLGF
jgi:hypothetical protein